MKKHLLILFWFLLPIFSWSQDGQNDLSFNPNLFNFSEGANGLVYSKSVQQDGKIVIVGNFTSYNGFAINRIARLNLDGTLDNSFNPGTGANNPIQTISIQNDGKILIGGVFTSINGNLRNRIARLNSDGSLDNTFNPGTGANSSIWTISVQSDEKIIIGGDFTLFNGTPRNYITRLNADGSIDNTFNTGIGAESSVFITKIQADGKIIAGGQFNSFNGNNVRSIVRLNSDGTLDNDFSPGSGANGFIRSISIQPDNKIIIAGGFSSYNGVNRGRIARINNDGNLDLSFNPGNGLISLWNTEIQSDGKIFIGGLFNNYNGVSRNNIARLNTDGSLDNSFDPGLGTNSWVYSITVQNNDKILVGGDFTSYNGESINRILLVNQNGSLDNNFNNIGFGANSAVWTTSVQQDGKIIIGGWFTSYNNTEKNHVARLNSDGSLDDTFNMGTGANGLIYASAIQTDGKILIGGIFTSYNGAPINRIARINPDGSIDNSFNVGSGADNVVYSIKVQPDGKILLAGNFINFNGVQKNRIVRVNNDGSIDPSFDTGSGFNNLIFTSSIQPDGKILLGGDFTNFNGINTNRIIRLNSNGSIDTTFNPGSGANNTIWTISLQTDGKILIGGFFNLFNGLQSYRILRLNSNGNIDNSFNPGTGANGLVNKSLVLPDGKIILVGSFISFNSSSANRIVKLNSDGSIDNSFNSGLGANAQILTTAIQSDGNILIGGTFTTFNNLKRLRINRLLNTVGSIPDPEDPEGGMFTVLSSDGDPLSNVEIRVFTGPDTWTSLITDENGQTPHTFSNGILNVNAIHEGTRSATVSIDFGANPDFTFYTSKVEVSVKGCDGTPIMGEPVRFFHDDTKDAWQLAVTDANGLASVQQFPGTHEYDAESKGSRSAYQSYNLTGDSQTAGSSLSVNSASPTKVSLVGDDIRFYPGGPSGGSWHTFTSSFIYIFEGSRTFRNNDEFIDADISGCSFTGAMIKLVDEINNPLANLRGTYRSRCGGSWTYNQIAFTTDSNGNALLNTTCTSGNWDGNITIRVNQTSLEQSVSINNFYQLAKVNVNLKDCPGNPLADGIVEQGGGTWVNQGTTDALGTVSFYAFPGNNVTARMRFNYGSETKSSIPVIFPATEIDFVTTKVNIQGGTVQIGSSGWPAITMPYELLPGTYNFRINGVQINGVEISGCEFNKTLLRVINEQGEPVAGATFRPACGGSWQTSISGATDANGNLLADVPQCMTKIRANVGNSSQELSKAQLTASNFIWTTEVLRVRLLDHAGNPITDGNATLSQGGGTWIDLGNLDATGSVSVNTFPVASARYRMTYKCTSETKQNFAVVSGAGIQVFDFQTGKIISQCATQYQGCGWTAFDDSGEMELMPGTRNYRVPNQITVTLAAGQVITLNDCLNVNSNPETLRVTDTNSMLIYPNPAIKDANIQVNLTQEADVEIIIFDTAGRLVFKEESLQKESFVKNINLDQYSQGMYHVVVKVNHQYLQGRLVKQ